MQSVTHLPRLAWLLGLGGLLPFGAATAAIWAGPPGLAPFAVAALAAYGATILSFLGAVHWGLALTQPVAAATAPRLIAGVLPALVGWIALLLPAPTGLGLLAGAILTTLGVEAAAHRRGWLPAGYLRLRRVLSIGAGVCLTLGAFGAARP